MPENAREINPKISLINLKKRKGESLLGIREIGSKLVMALQES